MESARIAVGIPTRFFDLSELGSYKFDRSLMQEKMPQILQVLLESDAQVNDFINIPIVCKEKDRDKIVANFCFRRTA